MLQPLAHQEILLFGHAKNGGSDMFRRSSPKPWRVPKHGSLPIPNDDIDESIEELHIILIARIPHSHPSAAQIRAFKPWPSQSQGSTKFLKVQNTKTSHAFGRANHLPFYFAFTTGDLVRLGRPKESTFKLGNGLQYAFGKRQGERI
jgi:hypothetical protein